MGVGPVLRFGHFSYAFPQGRDFVLREIDLDVYPGQCHCLTGPSGCGKTSLLLAARGLLPPGRRTGLLEIDTGTTKKGATAAGLVFQNPVTQLVSSELGAEVAFGLENHCIPPARMPTKVHRALADVGLDRTGETPVAVLSMGQQYRACLAGTLVMGPSIIMLDEPGAQLDSAGLDRLARIIVHLKSMGKAVLICEHRPGFLTEVIDYYWRFTSDGRLRADSDAPDPTRGLVGDAGDWGTSVQSGEAPPKAAGRTGDDTLRKSTKPFIRVRDLAMSGHGQSRGALLNFSVAAGQRVVVWGPNGAGKTTLVNHLAGLSRPGEGTIEIFGTAPEPGRLRGSVGVLFQNPRRQLFGTTVFEEVAFAAGRHHRHKSSEDVRESVRSLLALLDLSDLAQRTPHLLSYGQKHLVSLAAVLAGEPRILILDDPLAGLDDNKARRVMDLLEGLSERNGTVILCTSHHQKPWDGWAHLTVRLAPDPSRAADDPAIDPSEFAVPLASVSRKARLPLPTGAALVISIILAMSAFAARSIPLLAILTGVNLLLLLFRCPRPWDVLRRSARFFVWQAAFITLLYGLRFGWQSGMASGVRVAWQLFLAFWPGMVFVASNPASRVTRSLARVLPHQTAFVVSACLRFLPLLLGEMNAIRQAQIFRGAGLLRQDLKKPRFWLDWVHCLLVPTLVRALSMAADIALAAEARDFGIYQQRTHWPGDA